MSAPLYNEGSGRVASPYYDDDLEREHAESLRAQRNHARRCGFPEPPDPDSPRTPE